MALQCVGRYRYWFCPSVRPSVCLSVQRRYCVETAVHTCFFTIL